MSVDGSKPLDQPDQAAVQRIRYKWSKPLDRACSLRRRRVAPSRRAMFPQRLDSPLAYDIAKAMMDGFNRHYRLFRAESARAKHRFETADWHGQQRAQRERIEFYDLRVSEAVARLEKEFKAGEQPMEVWHQVKLHYIGLLVNHHQPELAETFFNSVTTKILHRAYFQNDFIFVRPADQHRVHRAARRAHLPRLLPARTTRWTTPSSACSRTSRCSAPFADLRPRRRARGARHPRALHQVKLRANFQLQVLSGLFFRNKGAYVVGKIINGFVEMPVRAADPARQPAASFYVDAALFGEDDLQMLFSFARAYFMVDMEVPSAYVQFLRSLMPRKPRAEIYNALGLAKQGKTLFYRDFLSHLNYSSDQFRIAPGIKGMVMLVFDLPSFPVRVQGHQGLLPAAEGHHARADQGQVPAGEAARPRGPHGRHAGVQRRGFSARPLRARADRRDREVRAQPARDRRPRRQRGDGGRAQARLHRAPHDPAQHLPAGGLRPLAHPESPACQRAQDQLEHARGRVRQRHQGHGGGQHLPGRHAVEELRRHARRQGRVLRLRRDRIHHRLQLPQGARRRATKKTR